MLAAARAALVDPQGCGEGMRRCIPFLPFIPWLGHDWDHLGNMRYECQKCGKTKDVYY